VNAIDTAGDPQRSRSIWILPIVTALILAFLAFQGWTAAQPQQLVSPVPGPKMALRPASAAEDLSRAPDTAATYYIVGSQEEAALVGRVMEQRDAEVAAPRVPRHVIRIATSADEEGELRRTIDAANKQLVSYGEPLFRIVDIRSSQETAH
jgi:hypothetical protein